MQSIFGGMRQAGYTQTVSTAIESEQSALRQGDQWAYMAEHAVPERAAT